MRLVEVAERAGAKMSLLVQRSSEIPWERIGAIRTGLREDRGTLGDALRRNVRFADDSKADALAAQLVALFERLERSDAEALLRGEIAA